jgi:hypothetical protein
LAGIILSCITALGVGACLGIRLLSVLGYEEEDWNYYMKFVFCGYAELLVEV